MGAGFVIQWIVRYFGSALEDIGVVNVCFYQAQGTAIFWPLRFLADFWLVLAAFLDV